MILRTDSKGPRVEENFWLHEFANKKDGWFVLMPDYTLPGKMQQVRNILGPCTITSGTRTWVYNLKVGGSPVSHHLTGLAVDFKANFDEWTKYSLIRLFKSIGFKNVKFYYRKNRNDRWYLHRCHVDLGKTWNGKDFYVLPNKYE